MHQLVAHTQTYTELLQRRGDKAKFACIACCSRLSTQHSGKRDSLLLKAAIGLFVPKRGPEGFPFEATDCNLLPFEAGWSRAWRFWAPPSVVATATRGAAPGGCMTGTSTAVMCNYSVKCVPSSSPNTPSPNSSFPAQRPLLHGGQPGTNPNRMALRIMAVPCTSVHTIAWRPSCARGDRVSPPPKTNSICGEMLRGCSIAAQNSLSLTSRARAAGSAVSHLLHGGHAT
jgi:hypothetical protein